MPQDKATWRTALSILEITGSRHIGSYRSEDRDCKKQRQPEL